MSNNKTRQIATLEMSTREEIARQITIDPSLGTSPDTDSAVCYLFDGDDDVSSTNLSGSASISGVVITTQLITGLTDGKKYKMITQWTDSGNKLEVWSWIVCKD